MLATLFTNRHWRLHRRIMSRTCLAGTVRLHHIEIVLEYDFQLRCVDEEDVMPRRCNGSKSLQDTEFREMFLIHTGPRNKPKRSVTTGSHQSKKSTTKNGQARWWQKSGTRARYDEAKLTFAQESARSKIARVISAEKLPDGKSICPDGTRKGQ